MGLLWCFWCAETLTVRPGLHCLLATAGFLAPNNPPRLFMTDCCMLRTLTHRFDCKPDTHTSSERPCTRQSRRLSKTGLSFCRCDRLSERKIRSMVLVFLARKIGSRSDLLPTAACPPLTLRQEQLQTTPWHRLHLLLPIVVPLTHSRASISYLIHFMPQSLAHRKFLRQFVDFAASSRIQICHIASPMPIHGSYCCLYTQSNHHLDWKIAVLLFRRVSFAS